MVNNKLSSCRICLMNTRVSGKSFDEDENMLQSYEFCNGISVGKSGSRFICEICLEDLERYAKFKKKCAESELFWESFNANGNTSADLKSNDSSELKTLIKKENISIGDLDVQRESLCADDEIYSQEESIKNDNETDYLNLNKTENSIELVQRSENKLFISNQIFIKNILPEEPNRMVLSSQNKTMNKINLKRKQKTFHQDKSNITFKRKYIKCKSKSECCNFYLGSSTIGGSKPIENTAKEKSELESSANEIDIKNRRNSCGLCKIVCSDSDDLKNHLLHHWEQNTLKCELCDYIGRDFADMVTHRVLHKCGMNHTNNKQLRCFVCKVARVGSVSLQFHFRQVHLNKDGGWCTTCGKTFKVLKTWKIHKRKHDNVDDLLVCDYCDKRFVYKYNLEEHILTHLRINQLVCEICGKRFLRKNGLTLHLKTVHSSNGPIKCEHCNKMYKSQFTLDYHMKEVNREKPYVCEICSKSFSVPSALRNHIFYHTGERPFDCDTCGSKFKNKSALTAHRLKRHMGVLNHKCLECQKSFFTSTQLKRHSTIHTGIKKFKCTQCDKGYNARDRLEAHLAKHKKCTFEVKSES